MHLRKIPVALYDFTRPTFRCRVKRHFHLDGFGYGAFQKHDVVRTSSLTCINKRWLFTGGRLTRRGLEHTSCMITAE